MGGDRVVSEADTHSCPSGAYILGGHFIKFLGLFQIIHLRQPHGVYLVFARFYIFMRIAYIFTFAVAENSSFSGMTIDSSYSFFEIRKVALPIPKITQKRKYIDELYQI